MANEKFDTCVVAVIEANLNHLIGVAIQRLSLRAHLPQWKYCLSIVDRGDGLAEAMLSVASALDLEVRFAPPSNRCRHLNKWQWMRGYHDDICSANHVVVLDWDVVAVRAAVLPHIEEGSVACRPNPHGIYADEIERLRAFRQLRDGSMAVEPQLQSVNSGVIIGSGPVLAACVDETLLRYDELAACGALGGWKAEQLAFSLALERFPFVALDASWNVTPLSSVEDARVVLWHFNDGTRETRLLKRVLTQPARVRALVASLHERWPSSTNQFLQWYEETTAIASIKAFLVETSI